MEPAPHSGSQPSTGTFARDLSVDPITVEIAFSGQDPGAMIGASPYPVSRILARWKRHDSIAAKRGCILILNWNRLPALTDGATN